MVNKIKFSIFILKKIKFYRTVFNELGEDLVEGWFHQNSNIIDETKIHFIDKNSKVL